jgi:hypothetical protein
MDCRRGNEVEEESSKANNGDWVGKGLGVGISLIS